MTQGERMQRLKMIRMRVATRHRAMERKRAWDARRVERQEPADEDSTTESTGVDTLLDGLPEAI